MAAGAAAKAEGPVLQLQAKVTLLPLDAGAARAELGDVAETAEENGLTRLAASRHPYAQVARIVGAGITGIGLAIFVQQIAQAV